MKKNLLFFGMGVLLVSPWHLFAGEPALPAASDGRQRYMLFSPPAANGGLPEIYVIDTLTGRIWKRTVFNDVKGEYLLPLPYLSADQTSASAAPTGSEAFETLALQKQYNAAIERARAELQARQRAASSPPANLPSSNKLP